MTIDFFAAGKPEPQGSSKGFVIKSKATGNLRAIVTSDNAKLKPWRATVQAAAQCALEQAGALRGHLIESSVCIEASFVMPTPKWAEAKLRKGKPVACVTRPDVDKLLRGLLDALTGIVFADDAQVVRVVASKTYAVPGSQPGVGVRIQGQADAAPVLELPDEEAHV